MLSPLELRIQRRLTASFIKRSPVTITLIPRESVKTPTGGIAKTTGSPRNPQVFTLVEPSNSGYQQANVVIEGSQTTFDYQLIGHHDAIIGKDDVFTHDGREYKIETLMHDNGYEKRAMVLRHGW
jgi:hypothetical protein